MNDMNQNHKTRLPLWQSEKMRAMIESRWQEVWEIAKTRHDEQRTFPQYLQRPRSNSDYD